MACTDRRSEQIGDFAVGRLSGTEADDLLDHLLACPDCSEEFDLVADLVTCLDRYGEELCGVRQVSVGSKILAKVREGWAAIRRRPALVRVLAPAAVVLALAFVVLYPSRQDRNLYWQLAQFEAPRYIPRSLRGPGGDETVKVLFEEGMAAYARGDFSKAIEKLSELTRARPEFGEAFFYLGISYLMKDKERRAADALQKAAALLEGYPLGEQSHWYLGMVYLKLEDRERALQEFQTVIDLQGAYKVNAERMMERINKVQGPKS